MMFKPSPRLIRAVLLLCLLGYVAFFTTQLLLHYYSFGSRSLDLGNMDQAIWNTLHGRPFHQTNQPGANNRLSLHVEPILVPISLLYLIYSGPEILFLFQTMVVAAGAISVFALARYKLNSEGLALVFALVYLMFPAIQGANLLDFHAVTLAPTFLLAAFYYLETDRPKRFALFAVLAAACKEDITLLVLMLGLYAFFVKRRRRLGLATVSLAGLWAFLAVFVIPPLFAGTDNIHWNRYGHLGDSPVEMVANLFIQPHLFIDHLRAVNALEYLRLLLAPTAYTALLNPLTLLLALPSLGINLLSNFPPMQRVNSLIYAAPLVPAVIISSIYGLANLKRMILAIPRPSQALEDSAPPASPPFRFTVPPGSVLSWSFALVLLTATLLYHTRYGYFPWGGQFRGWEEVTDHHRRASQVFARIPSEAALSAHDRLNPHVSQREILYIFDRIDDADHIILDVTEDSWPLHPVALRHQVDRFLEEGFGVVAATDGYLLLANRPADLPDTLPDEFFDFARAPDPANFRPNFPVSVTFDDKVQLVGYDLSLGAHEKFLPVLTLYWRALQPLEDNYTLWPFFIDRHGQVIEDTSERPLVTTLWYPTDRWSPEEIIITRTLPWDLAPEIGDQFTLALGVARSDWADPARRLPITQADDRLYTFDTRTWARLATFERTGRKSYEWVKQVSIQPRQPRQVQFWNLIDLEGVDLPSGNLQPGEALPFTLYWQATAPITVDFTTFAHLLDWQGNVVAQLDWTPQDSLGYLPTSAWQPGRPVIDRQSLPLPGDLPPGQYRLIGGWYYPATGERLPLTANDRSPSGGDVVELGVVVVE